MPSKDWRASSRNIATGPINPEGYAVRRERLPRVDRQHAAARFQALQVRLGWPAALQQDSRLQVRAEIDASALGRFPRRIHDLPVKAAKLLSPLPPPRRNGMLRKQVRWQLLSDCHCRRGGVVWRLRLGSG